VQRYRCLHCGKSFSENQPLDGLRVDFDKACQVVNLLCEGMGIRAASRLTGLDRGTVLAVLETAGARFAAFLDAKVRNVKAGHVQIDELFTYVYSKPANTPSEYEAERGDFFTFLSVERDSKLLINWRVGKRDQENTVRFLQDLRARVQPGFALTSDCFPGYVGKRDRGNVKYVFGTHDITYATEMKMWAKQTTAPLAPNRYFQPLIVTGIKRQQRIGQQDLSESTICHAERMNLSVRTFTRRFTRCTIGYSKKLANLRHAVAMFVCHFNFCRKHSAHRQTPAIAAGLTDHVWTVRELLNWNA
jgi:IS1 family transposase